MATAPLLVETFKDTSDGPSGQPASDGRYVIVLEEPTQRLDARPLEGLRSVGEMASISMAYHFIIPVHALHDLGYVHCDLKPSDFLRFPDPRLPEESHPRLSHYSNVQKLFSLTDAAGEADGEAGGETVQTEVYLRDAAAAYCSPEVASAYLEGTKVVVSEKMDVWSLGLILYELFTHKPLLDGCFNSDAVHVPRHANWTAEEVITTAELETAHAYRSWLVRNSGGQTLVDKVKRSKDLSDAQHELLLRMLQ
eukprot:1086835-Prymnesium_polylepis.1